MDNIKKMSNINLKNISVKMFYGAKNNTEEIIFSILCIFCVGVSNCVSWWRRCRRCALIKLLAPEYDSITF